MARRKSVNVKGLEHANPMPNGCRIGSLFASSPVIGKDERTGQLPASLDAQCENMFRHVRMIIEAAGGSVEDIIKVDIAMLDRGARDVMNRHWTALFPDPAARPARHTTQADIGGGHLVQCTFLAVLDGK